MIENWTYNDIVLYSKGWYKSHGDMVEDLAYLFSKIYGWEPTSEEEVARMMLRVIDRLYEAKEVKFSADAYMKSFEYLFNEVNNKMKFYNISYSLAVIQICLSILFELENTEIKLNPPHYGKKEHFRLGGFGHNYPISMTYTQMNRIANKWFNKK